MGKRQFLILLIFIILLISGVQYSVADDTSPKDNPTERESIILDNVPDTLDALLQRSMKSVTGAKREQLNDESPSFVSVITAKDIERYGYNTLGDALRGLAGIYVSYDRNYEYLGIRGISLPGDYNSRILVLINGHAINDSMYGSGPIGTEFPLDVRFIERIEVIRGPGSALYGSNAVFGVINVITKKVSNNPKRVENSVVLGSQNKVKEYFRYGSDFRKFGEIFASASIMNTKGARLYFKEFKDTPSGGYTSNTDYDRYLKLLATHSRKGFSAIGVLSAREKGIPTASWETAFDDDRTKTVDAYGFLALNQQIKFSNKSKISLKAYWSRYRYLGFWPYYDLDSPLLDNHQSGK